jgi:hypothetical protein
MSSFTLQLQQFADKTKAHSDEVVGRVVVTIAQRLDERSPVDTGRFRGNWQLGIESVPQGETGRLDPGGSATVGAIIAGIPAEAAGHIYYLTNNVPYAQRLEEGWSKQAPDRPRRTDRDGISIDRGRGCGMSLAQVRAALETALNSISPAIDTAWENAPYTPVDGTPYQQATLLRAQPDNSRNWPDLFRPGHIPGLALLSAERRSCRC